MYESFLGVNPWTALLTLVNTLLVFFVARKYLFDPVTKIIEDRQQEIDEMYSEANTAQESARTMERAYREKLSVAADTGEQIVREATARAQSRQEQILRQASAEATAIRNKASADIALEKKKAVKEAKAEISDLALAIAEKVIGRELGQKDQEKLVDRFIDELGDQL